MLRLPRLPEGVEIVDTARKATALLILYWQQFADAIEDAITQVVAAQAAADQAQNDALQGIQEALAAQAAADSAQATADDAVRQDVGPAWAAPSGTASRAIYTAYSAPAAALIYDPVQMQALMDAQQATSQALVAFITDAKANGTLT